ncbi:MAG TPA: hypothetical protein VMP86_01285 [Candidatus Binatia bacterium]|nr:hypothetical protein [Candidatus Binatia bacterium]
MRDRLDFVVHLEPGVAPASGRAAAEPTAAVARRVARAADAQRHRQSSPNAELPPGSLDAERGFDRSAHELLETRGRQLGLSMRRLHRAARVARTIADLEGATSVRADHLDEALLHRPKEAHP